MLEKHYDHKAIEKHWYPSWEDSGLFHSEIDDKKPPYTLVIPPPNVTGRLHMGHVLNNTIQDILIRFKRMNGFNTCWVPGTDHAGIATQNMVEKELRGRGIDPERLTREQFLEHVWEWREKFGGIITRQLRLLGSSCDWRRERFTMDAGLSRAVTTFFKRLYDKGLVYRDKYIVNWCPALQTALSDDEVERNEEASHLWHFKYPVMGETDTYLVVATTRPETMFGDSGVAVHPEDERYAHLVGKTILLPIVGREIPIVADPHVEKEFGTGCVKVTPAHDLNDFEMGRTHKLEFIIIMDKTAHMNENVPPEFQGLERYACRKAVVAKMDQLGLLDKIEDHTVAIGRCYRTGSVIEPYLSEQWFIKMEDLAKRALTPVEEKLIRFYPARWANTYRHWLTHIKDWCISRQLIWGHRIPVWYCADCGGESCAAEPILSCTHCGSDRIEQDPDVLDTWASSWLWPLSVFGWPDKTPDLDYYYPTQTLVTAADIIFFWVARMIIAGQEFMDEEPFSQVYFNGIVRDLKGRKMSKTLGNSSDPIEVIDQYGADALRFTIVYNTPFGQDTRFADESCELGRGFCTKIWNANRFLQMTFEDVSADADWSAEAGDMIAQWILSRLSDTIEGMSQDLESFRLAAAASRIYNFFWGEFCDWYVEFLKPAVKNASAAEKAVLLGRTTYVIETCLRLLHPFMPFVTEELWHHLAPRGKNDFLVLQPWPKRDPAHANPEADAAVATLQELISGVRAVRKSYGLPNNAAFRLYLRGDADQRRRIDRVSAILLKLAGLDHYEFLDEDGAPRGCTAISLKGMSAYLDLRGHLDIPAELAKIDKKVAKLAVELKSLEARLNNPKFAAKAPPKVVAKVRDEHGELTRQIVTLKQTRADLEKLG